MISKSYQPTERSRRWADRGIHGLQALERVAPVLVRDLVPEHRTVVHASVDGLQVTSGDHVINHCPLRFAQLTPILQ